MDIDVVMANEADISFSVDGSVGFSVELEALSVDADGGISVDFGYDIELVSVEDDIDIEVYTGMPACLGIRGLTGTTYTHGVIESFEQLSVGRENSVYKARLVPTLTPLKYTRNSRIFQRVSILEIFESVIASAGYSSSNYRFALQGSYEKRDYCVQYQESDWAFLNRLLEEEGVFYYFEHTREADVMVLGDGEHAINPLPTAPSINFRDESLSTVLQEEAIYRFQGRSSIQPGTATMRDFRFKQPQLNLETSDNADKDTKLELYHYPGDYTEPSVGQRLVKVRNEEMQAVRQRFTGRSTVRALVPGYRFTLNLHPRSDFNQEYLVVRVHYTISQAQSLREEQGAGQYREMSYQAHFICIPIGVPFRPSRSTARPIIPGIQSAMVVGPAGEEIYCDEYGRVKVQFHWDRLGKRDEHSSCWIRVSQPWAGVSDGGIFLPRIGQEVLIHFLEGDPDRPVIVGRVYNADSPVPYKLPDHKTRSTIKSASSPGGRGFNEFRFEDLADHEEIYLRAQKDWNTDVLHDLNRWVGRHEGQEVGVDRHRKVGNNESINIGVNRSINVGSNESTNIGINKSINIGKNDSKSVGSNQSINIGSNRSLNVGNNHDVNIGQNHIVNIGGDHNHHCHGPTFVVINRDTTLNIDLNLYATIGINLDLSVSAIINLNVGIDLNIGVTANINISIGIDINITPGGNLNICAGAAVFILTPLFKTLAIDYSVQAIQASICAINLDLTGVAQVNITGSRISVTGGLIDITGGMVGVQGGLIRLNC